MNQQENGPHEANFLKLDCSRIKKVFGWKPVWGVEEALQKVVEWSKIYAAGKDVEKCMEQQIEAFIKKENGYV